MIGFAAAKLVLGDLPESWPNDCKWNTTLIVLYTFDVTMYLLFALVFKNMLTMFVILKATKENEDKQIKLYKLI